MSAPKLPISAYVICKDEEDMIADCLESLSCCEEIVVVDSGSTDGTLDIVQRLSGEGLPIRLLHNDWPGYALQKQYALEQCTQPWCLCVDADERLDDELVSSLSALVESKEVVAWSLPRRLYLYRYGYAHPLVRKTGLVRLTRNGRARYDSKTLVHEHIIVDGKTEKSRKGALLHRRALPVHEQVLKENTYARLKARQLFEAGKKPRLGKLLFNPAYYFVRIFFLNRNFLNGWTGFIHSVTGAIYAFQTEAILYEMYLDEIDS